MTRDEMHIKALSKGVDSQKIKGSMTVVLLGHAVNMMMEMQDQHEAELKAKEERIAELEAELKVYKAKLNSLGKHCEEQGSIIFAQNINNQCFSHNYSYNQGKVYVYQDILQKLEIDEEEGKEQ